MVEAAEAGARGRTLARGKIPLLTLCFDYSKLCVPLYDRESCACALNIPFSPFALAYHAFSHAQVALYSLVPPHSQA